MPQSVFEPKDIGYVERVRASFARQGAMATLGATLAEVSAGRAVIELPWAQALTQQHGFLHAGMVAAALDSACGYAGFSLMPADAAVVKPGRTTTVTEGRVYAIDDGRHKLIATMACTLMAVTGRDGIEH